MRIKALDACLAVTIVISYFTSQWVKFCQILSQKTNCLILVMVDPVCNNILGRDTGHYITNIVSTKITSERKPRLLKLPIGTSLTFRVWAAESRVSSLQQKLLQNCNVFNWLTERKLRVTTKYLMSALLLQLQCYNGSTGQRVKACQFLLIKSVMVIWFTIMQSNCKWLNGLVYLYCLILRFLFICLSCITLERMQRLHTYTSCTTFSYIPGVGSKKLCSFQ